ncbi:MAG: M14 family zinc carboxypeptidase [Bacteroidota bacterium]
MKSKFLLFVLSFLCLNFSSFSQEIYSKVKVSFNSENYNQLISSGIPLESAVKTDNFLSLDLSSYDIKKLNNLGFSVEIQIPNLSKFYVERNLKSQSLDKSIKSSSCSNTTTYATPSHFRLGSMGGFLTNDELNAELDSMRKYYPNLITAKAPISPTQSIEGRNIYFVKISDNPTLDENEPEMFYTGLTHAREPAGMQQLVLYMWYLLENYNSNPEIKYLVDNLELFFVPCVNPDGYVYNQTTDPNGGGMHRKNTRANGTSNPGADLNRNYGYQWGYDDIGSSTDPAQDNYRGTVGFSEPETQAMKYFCENHNFLFGMDYHCYSNVLLYPWGYQAETQTNDSTLFRTYSALMTIDNGFVYGTPKQVPAIGYTANGGSFDWYYGETTTKNKIISWSPEAGEVSDGFWPASNRIELICKSNLSQNLYMARFALKYALANDLNPYFISNTIQYLKFDIKNYAYYSPASYTVSMESLNPSLITFGSAKTINGMSLFQQNTDSIQVTFSPSITNGQEFSYVISIDNGSFIYRDTITKVYGQTSVAFVDLCNNTNKWTVSSTWGTTSNIYFSSPSSITDSPNGNYTTNANKNIKLTSPVNLYSASNALLTFYAKWDIEKGYDYVQLCASSNGTNWTPLCGKHTSTGTANQLVGQPLYDGIQSNWVKEEIDLANFVGGNIYLRFLIKSNNSTGWSIINKDGFYFDDITIETISPSVVGVQDASKLEISIQPNPVEDIFYVNNSGLDNSKYQWKIELFSINGKLVYSGNVDTSKNYTQINSSFLEKGVYIIQLNNGRDKTTPIKLIKI